MIRRLALVVPLLALTACGQGSPGLPPDLSVAPPPSSAAPVPARGAIPVAIRIPAIQAATTDVKPLGLDKSGALEVPPLSKPEEAGWYCPDGLPKCGAPMPGAIGPTIMAAHINAGGKLGAFAHLAQAKIGDTVEVDRVDHTTAVFTVTDVKIFPKAKFPTQSIYGDTTDPELRLITCGPNDLDTKAHSYRDQTAVWAKLTTIQPTP